MSDDECSWISKEHGFDLTPREVRTLREEFVARFPSTVRGLLCRYTLTLSDRFREIIRPVVRKSWFATTAKSSRWAARRFVSYTSKLRNVDGRQSVILFDEMESSLILDNTLFMRPGITFEAIVYLWLKAADPIIDPRTLQHQLREFTEERLHNGERYSKYREMLHAYVNDDKVSKYDHLDKVILPGIVDYICWLQQYNPIDQIATKGTLHVH